MARNFLDDPSIIKFQPGDLIQVNEMGKRIVLILQYDSSFRPHNVLSGTQVYTCVWLTDWNVNVTFNRSEMYFHPSHEHKYELLAHSAT